MFGLTIQLYYDSDEDLKGLEALDMRRSLGLSDRSELTSANSERTVDDVPEWFARKHEKRFGANNRPTAVAHWRHLTSADVTIVKGASGNVGLRELTTAQAMDIATRVWAD